MPWRSKRIQQRRLLHHPRRLLDACCGTGTVAEMLTREGFEVSGFYISAPMIERARAKAQRKRRRNPEAAVLGHVASGHVSHVAHQIQPERRAIGGAEATAIPPEEGEDSIEREPETG